MGKSGYEHGMDREEPNVCSSDTDQKQTKPSMRPSVISLWRFL